jgi:type I restriction enzyme S subunit
MASSAPIEDLADVAQFLNSKRKPVTAADRTPGPYPYYGAAAIQDWVSDYIFDGTFVLVGEDGTVQTSNGKLMVQLAQGKIWVNNHAHVLRSGSDEDTRYLAYALAQVDAAPFITGAAQPKINMGNLKRVAVPWPTSSVRAEISEIGRALDDRINLLRQTNATLEAIAQALYKSWFVDFDPMRAKAEEREPVGMSSAAATLFPSEFEESEIGQVPKGWSTTSVYLLAKYINGAAYKAFDPNAEQRGLPIIKIAELKAGVTRSTAYSEVEMPEKIRIDTGEILFSWSGNPDTSIDTFVWSGGPAWLNQHIFRVVVEQPRERSFVLTTLKSLRPVFAEIARNKQTTGLGHVTVGDLKETRVISPPADVLVAWGEVVDPIWERSLCNQMQIQLLSTLRDTLISRLISGKNRVSGFEELIGDATA